MNTSVRVRESPPTTEHLALPSGTPQLNREYQRKWSAKRRLFLWNLKSVPCADCGIQYQPWQMQFDHVRGEKLFGISDFRASEAAVIAEVAKCDVVCANCHADRTYRRQNSGAVAEWQCARPLSEGRGNTRAGSNPARSANTIGH